MSIVDEEKRSKLRRILAKHFPFSHNIKDAIVQVEALFKQEEQLPDVHAGRDYRCIKDFYMNKDSSGDRAFTEGLVYGSIRTSNDWSTGITRIWFIDDVGRDHSISLPNKAVPFWEYFEEVQQ